MLVHIFVIVLAGTSPISTMGAALEPSGLGQRAADQVPPPPPSLDSVATEFSGTSAPLVDTWDKSVTGHESPRDASSSPPSSSRASGGVGSGNHIVSNSSKLTFRSLRQVVSTAGEGGTPPS